MKLRLLLLLLGTVLLLHWGALNWLSDQVHQIGGSVPLAKLAEPMFTRTLEQTQVPERMATSTAQRTTSAKPKPQKQAAPKTVIVATATDDAAPQQPTALPEITSAPDSALQTEDTAAPATTALDNPIAELTPPKDTWPPDTRLTYRLSGNYRGELTGNARVQWQQIPAPDGKSDPRRYQVRLDMSLSSFVIASMTSQGKITEAGLIPEIYEENLPGAVRRVAFEETQIHFNNGRVDVRPTTVQDTASQFVELSHRFATGVETLQAGAEVRVWLARPGGLDFWTYDVLPPEILQTPELGAIEAFHLKPRPLANPRGPIVAEMWFAPSLQYLPVRVRISLGGGNFVDLMVERIEQSQKPPALEPKETQAKDPT